MERLTEQVKCNACDVTKPICDFYPKNRVCKVCYLRRVKDRYNEKAEKLKAYARSLYAKNKDEEQSRRRQYYLEHRHQENARNRAYYEANKTALLVKASEYRRDNPHVKRLSTAKRRAAKLNATPAWADKSAINKIYKEAELLSLRSGAAYHVDHIVPLISDVVCGLHVENNLQVLTAAQNTSKGNRWWPDMP